MKYIKYFEGFDNPENWDKEIEDNMRDYMLPLSDRGFTIRIYINYKIIVCEIKKSDNDRDLLLDQRLLEHLRFKFGEIKEDVYGLVNFMNHTYDIDISNIVYVSYNRGALSCCHLSDIADDSLYDISLYFEK